MKEADIIREIYQMYLDGNTLKQIKEWVKKVFAEKFARTALMMKRLSVINLIWLSCFISI